LRRGAQGMSCGRLGAGEFNRTEGKGDACRKRVAREKRHFVLGGTSRAGAEEKETINRKVRDTRGIVMGAFQEDDSQKTKNTDLVKRSAPGENIGAPSVARRPEWDGKRENQISNNYL